MAYLLKLPRLAKKVRVISGWTLELLFSREIEKIITLSDVEELTNRMSRIRARTASAGSSGSKKAEGGAGLRPQAYG